MLFSNINFEPLKEKTKFSLSETLLSIVALIAGALVLALVVFGVYLFIKLWRQNNLLGAAKLFAIGIPFVWLITRAMAKYLTPSQVVQNFITANQFKTVNSNGSPTYEQMLAFSGRLYKKKLDAGHFVIDNAFTGELMERTFSCFEFAKSAKKDLYVGESVILEPYMLVLDIDLKQPMPHIFIVKKKNGMPKGWDQESLYLRPKNYSAINKDVKNLDIYSPDKYEPESLTLLNPRVLEIITKYSDACDIEFLEERLIIYQRLGAFGNRHEIYKQVFGFAEELVNGLETILRRWRFQTPADASSYLR